MRTALAHAICALSLPLIACACGDGKPSFAGKWQSVEEKGLSIEIVDDGTALMNVGGSVVATGWQKIDDHRFMIAGAGERAAMACVSGNAMHLWFKTGPGAWFERQVPEKSAERVPNAAALKDCADMS